MGHGLTNSDRMADVGKMAWHGLGMALPEGMGAEDACIFTGTQAPTRLDPIMTIPQGLLPGQAGCKIIPDYFAHVDADSGDLHGIVQKDYVPVENIETARFADGLFGMDRAPVCESIGTLFGRRRFWCLMRMARDIVLPKEDRVATYVAVANGHGGTAAFSCYPTTVRIVCANTLRLSEKDLSRGVRFIHRAGGDKDAMAEKLKTAQLVMGFADKSLAKFEEEARALAGKQWARADVVSYFAVVFRALWPLADGADKLTVAKHEAKQSETCAQWLRVFESERCAAVFGGNAWTGSQAVTDWLDHSSGRGKAQTGTAERTASNLFGAADKQKAVAMKMALASL